MIRFLKHYLTIVFTAIGCMFLFTACPFAESFDTPDEKINGYDVAVVNQSDQTIFTLVKIAAIPLEGDSVTHPVYPTDYNEPTHPANVPYFIELAPQESYSYHWEDYQYQWRGTIFTVAIVASETFKAYTPDKIIEDQLFDEVISLTGPEVEAENFRIVFKSFTTDDNNLK